jgi:hypothetical protein
MTINVTEITRRADLDFCSDAMQPYCLAILDWVDVLKIER